GLEKLQRRSPIDRLAQLSAEGVGADGDGIEIGGDEEVVRARPQRQRPCVVKIVKDSIFKKASPLARRQLVGGAALPVGARHVVILEAGVKQQVSGDIDQEHRHEVYAQDVAGNRVEHGLHDREERLHPEAVLLQQMRREGDRQYRALEVRESETGK